MKVRPGFTPQEDIRRFRGTKQAQMDTNALPKGHIMGWAPPPDSTKPGGNSTSSSTTTPMTKAAKKNAKRKEKRQAEKEKEVPENWEDDDEQGEVVQMTKDEKEAPVEQSVEDTLSTKLEQLEVK